MRCFLILTRTRYPKDYEKGRRHGEFQRQPQPIVLEVSLWMSVQQNETMNPRNREHMARKKELLDHGE